MKKNSYGNKNTTTYKCELLHNNNYLTSNSLRTLHYMSVGVLYLQVEPCNVVKQEFGIDHTNFKLHFLTN